MSTHYLSDLFYQIKLLNQKIEAFFDQQAGIQLTRYRILTHLLTHSMCTQTDLHHVVCIDSGAITRHLKQLEEKQLVVRIRNPYNQREILVSLTEKARELLTGNNNPHIHLKEQFQQLIDKETVLKWQAQLVELSTIIDQVVDAKNNQKGE